LLGVRKGENVLIKQVRALVESEDVACQLCVSSIYARLAVAIKTSSVARCVCVCVCVCHASQPNR